MAGKKKYLNLLWWAMLGLLWLPIVQERLGIWEVEPLHGHWESTDTISFSWENWLEGDFQANRDSVYSDRFGFRNSMVRLRNQLDLWMFDKVHAKQVLVGKDHYLYERNYILEALGQNFVGRDSISRVCHRLREVQDSLMANDVAFLVVMVPGKGSYYPEYIPDEFGSKVGPTNFEVYMEEMSRQGIQHVDFNSWFHQMKDTSRYPLFPKAGIHWSKYGEIVAMDSLLGLVSLHTGARTKRVVMDGVELKVENSEEDMDIGKGLNLLLDPPTFPMGYPNWHWDVADCPGPRTTVVADSYFWGMFNLGVSSNALGAGQFWYYNKQVFPDSYKQPTKVHDLDLRKELLDLDMVVLLSTDANLYKFPFDFDIMALRALRSKD